MLKQFLSVYIAVEDKYLVQTSDEINSYATRKWRIARSKGLIHTTDYSHCPKNNLNLRIEAEPVTLLDHPHCPKNNLNVYIKSKPVTAEVDATVHASYRRVRLRGVHYTAELESAVWYCFEAKIFPTRQQHSVHFYNLLLDDFNYIFRFSMLIFEWMPHA